MFKPATTPTDDVKSPDLDALARDATALLMGEESRLAQLRACPNLDYSLSSLFSYTFEMVVPSHT